MAFSVVCYALIHQRARITYASLGWNRRVPIDESCSSRYTQVLSSVGPRLGPASCVADGALARLWPTEKTPSGGYEWENLGHNGVSFVIWDARSGRRLRPNPYCRRRIPSK